MSWWPAVESNSDLFPINARAAMFSRHGVFASREHAYCAVLAANLEPGGWRIDEEPDDARLADSPAAVRRCVLSILDDGADWKGLFCWDSIKTVLTWHSYVWAREKGRPEDQRKAYLSIVQTYQKYLPLGVCLSSALGIQYSEGQLDGL